MIPSVSPRKSCVPRTFPTKTDHSSRSGAGFAPCAAACAQPAFPILSPVACRGRTRKSGETILGRPSPTQFGKAHPTSSLCRTRTLAWRRAKTSKFRHLLMKQHLFVEGRKTGVNMWALVTYRSCLFAIFIGRRSSAENTVYACTLLLRCARQPHDTAAID
jgi:hypothetical protein